MRGWTWGAALAASAAQITFVTGPDGRLTHAVMHQGGRNLSMPRLDHREAAA
ncbi:MAG TPA: hypothetical protein VHX64_08335 [Caulobacteraceae bacterium]|jgi:hypothetical protein|nr:hypothetical protein [Caulobacteraceae bacterium]